MCKELRERKINEYVEKLEAGEKGYWVGRPGGKEEWVELTSEEIRHQAHSYKMCGAGINFILAAIWLLNPTESWQVMLGIFNIALGAIGCIGMGAAKNKDNCALY